MKRSKQEIRDFLQPDMSKGMRCPLCSWTSNALQDCDFCKGTEDNIVEGLMAFFYPVKEPVKVVKPAPKKPAKKRGRKKKK